MGVDSAQLEAAYCAFRGFDENPEGQLSEMLGADLQSGNSDFDWLRGAVASGDRKLQYFAALVLRMIGKLPEDVYATLIGAGIEETDPSNNRWFIEPCLVSHGYQAVITSLMERFKHGTDSEKAGASNAFYWTAVNPDLLMPPSLAFRYDDPQWEPASDEARSKADAVQAELSDLRAEVRKLLLTEFVNNSSTDVRRSIIPQLCLEHRKYPPELHRLVEEAVRIARQSDDDYIRHRVEVQLGNEHLLRPLPKRSAPGSSRKPWWRFW